MTQLICKFKFDAAHRLKDYKGKCNNIHGHTWKVAICVSGKVDENSGMVMDFADIKSTIGKWIETHLDHSLIYNVIDEKVSKWVSKLNYKSCGILGEPTCENIANIIYKKALDLLKSVNPSVFVQYVRVWESETTSVVYGKLKETKK